MATGSASGQRPELLSRIDVRDIITGVVAIPHEDAVISTSEDKSVKVWVKRDNGQFWPSIVQSFEATCSVLEYEAEEESDGHLVFVGLGNGQIQEFRLSKDLNRFERKRTYHSHSARVTSIKLISQHDWVISAGRDKRFQWCCTKTGRSLGSYDATAWCLAVDYDDYNRYAFVANYSGVILVLKLDERNFHLVTTLKGHTCSVWALSYDHERRILFSGGMDQVIVVWDIGSQQGTAYELTGHTGKIRALAYSPLSRKLFSTAEDGKLGVWDMDVEREETPEWGGSNTCEKCGIPFFWNVRGMWENKSIGVRQHHCRKCGRAICGSCSNQQSTYPKMGFEKPVRMCQDCHSTLTTDDRSPMATFYDLKNPTTAIDIVQNEGLMVTASEDKFIKLWNISALMNS